MDQPLGFASNPKSRSCRLAPRRALDFLNEVTTEDLRLYGIEIRLFRIGNSKPAPQFQIVARPNEYARPPKSSAPSTTGQLYLDFWTDWQKVAHAKKAGFKPQGARAQHWSTVSVGRSGFRIELTASVQKRRLGCELYIDVQAAEQAFDALKEHKAAIEQVTGELQWMRLKDKHACRIVRFRPDFEVSDRTTWPEAYEWMAERVVEFRKAFQARVKTLDLSVEVEAEADD